METKNLSVNQARQQIKILRQVWNIIFAVLDKEREYIPRQYFAINLKEERDHLKFKPESVTNFLTIREGAIYFSVKWIIEPLINGSHYTIKDLYKCRQSCLWGESLAVNFDKELRQALKNIDLQVILSFDYSLLQGVKREDKDN